MTKPTKPTIEEMLDRVLSNQSDIMCALRSINRENDAMLANSQRITLDMIGRWRASR